MREVARVFLKLGFLGFGGPAAHLALMHDEVVSRRRWMDDREFLDLWGATNVIPGPNSTEMALHIGRRQGGWHGFLAAGACFIGPSTLITLGLAWLYSRYGATPPGEAVMRGLAPVVLAVVVRALWSLGRTAVKGPVMAAIGAAALGLYLAGMNEVVLLGTGALVATLWSNRRRVSFSGAGAMLPWWALGLPVSVSQPAGRGGVQLWRLLWTFLKMGSLLYGSGYVLLAFLRRDLVEGLGWVTDRQLLDGVAIGQLTPGPLFSSATFIGYLVAGFRGATLATLGVFLPAFLLVAATSRFLPRLRRSRWAGAALDGVNATALGLMAGVTMQLAVPVVADAFPTVLGAVALVVLLLWRINSAWVLAAGAAASLLYALWS